MKTVAVVIPVYNGASTITNIIQRIPWNEVDHVFAIDDGSTDNSWNVLQKIEMERDNFTALQHKENRGYGGAQKTLYDAVLKCRKEIAVMIHQDEHYAPEDIPKVVAPIQKIKGVKVVLARRRNMLRGGYPLHRYIGNRILTKIQNGILGLNLYEYHTGFRAYSSDLLKKIDYHGCSDGFHFDSDIIGEIKNAGFANSIVEVDTGCHYRTNQSANPHIFRYALNCIMSSYKYRFKKIIKR